ncbi:LEAF RUST 10 DISEASE-RESISTANCE LOCUS RECEPTOR-LIKE PROTEIN KINASE-like 1.1 isoform X4 [Corylus avellana]|uniref:LEAF RUST 10 DISEASE-RESISTANCE LOCUS RECEPTOR-LIKE PROTEIN KINASE-like 1.1 isoform X4 n=1 Tax=Corylus avellana TaxID=13451 RepID=UPI00286AF429|nr:LEAF RUST 10 DISEASE-RESISTANCE LOCUS RECEPTOR-LIKE PROTEIN KINASE-like 1.1 isoform X4 [Corylus avellana]
MDSFFLFVFSLLSLFVLPLSCYPQTQRCPPSHCSNLGPFRFPFTTKENPECGVFTVDCGYPYATIQLEDGGRPYEVLSISQADTIRIKDTQLGEHFKSNICEPLTNLTFPSSSFFSIQIASPEKTFFKCNRPFHIHTPKNFKKKTCNDYIIYYSRLNDSIPSSLSGCSIIQLPKNQSIGPWPDDYNLFGILSPEFELGLHISDECKRCYYRGGQCKASHNRKFYCDGAEKERNRHKLAIAFGVVCPVIFFIMICVFFIIRHHYKKKYASSTMLAKNANSDPSSRSDLEGGSVYYGVPVYSYSELEEATNNFDTEKELGDGGFGIVYYGKLRDGREVAVKRLYEHNYRRVAQFMNEVEILTRLRHKNLVSLYGCTSHRSRQLLLVYEYIPNGTVADHIHGERATLGSLTWPTRMNIAIETATALAYLHASEIIHRDVKTNNILLDKNFCVKVADFGLSRLFPNDVSHVSTAPQGTPGYVDPEYHQCYQLTTKSDVYSFGVVLIELISSLPAVDIARHRHEINLANLAISKIEKSAFHELIDPHLGFESDKEVERMTILVAQLAFQCIQQDKETRPSMDEVLEALKQIQSGNDAPEDQEKGFDDDVVVNVKPPISPESDEVALLKTKQLPPSPISVNTNWTSRSTTPNISS